ncbi:unnamed protein product [Brassica rapa]|uniref:SGS domain-containing protein n=1 Tax=Brassica campestris TaxID=3711 RepID=A0A3P5Z1W6_BRACM|nr:unnamed protein product [Brassica rapa]VDC67110.1 unnamed protein product [Brassica rapa]
MANALVFLSDLHTGRSSSSVQVRLFCFWEARSVRRGGDHMGVDMLLLDSQLIVVIDVPGEEAYHLQPRLILRIIIEKCLAKSEIITWASLEHDKGPTSLDIWNFGADVSMRLAYTSSKRVKDWDKLEAGTVFSIDRKEVGTKKIESTPPDGMELKKWEI